MKKVFHKDEVYILFFYLSRNLKIMETNEQTNPGLHIDLANRSSLTEAAKWGKFLAIVGFVMCGLIVILAFFIGTIMTSLGALGSMGDMEGMEGMGGSGLPGFMGGAFLTVLYLLIGLLYFFPCLFLFRFADKMQLALRSEDQQYLTTSFENLKSLFKFMGILTIIVLCLYALGILIAIISAAAFI